MNKNKYPKRVLQVSVSDIGFGGAFAFVMNVMKHIDNTQVVFDFCPAEQMSEKNEKEIIKLGGKILYIHKENENNKIKKFTEAFINYNRLLKDNHYKVIHIHSDITIKLFIYSIIAKFKGVNTIILHSHSTNIDGNHRRIKKILHYLFKPLLPFTGIKFMACSTLAAEWMYPKKICKSNRVKVVNNGIDADKYRFNPEIRKNYREQLNLEDKFVIGNIARFAYPKNHEFLIDIFAEIYKKNKNAILLLIGEGELEQDIKDKVNEMGLSDNVIFYGTTYEIPKLLQVMDVFVLPSRFEGLGIVLIEAQAAGLKCFTSADVVPMLAKVTDLLEFIPLTKSAKEWAEIILKYQNGYQRNDMYMDIVKANFDIHTVAKYMEKIYLEF